MSNRSQTAPCLLQEINNFDPRPEPDAFLNKPSSVAGHVNCGHVWLTNPDRSRVPGASDRPEKDSWYRIAATCHKCRSHIDLVLIYDDACTNPCPSNGHPYHHFTHISIESKDTEKSGLFQFACSSPTCQALLIVHFQRPVLTIVDMSHFSNIWAIKARLQEARKYHPTVPERGPAETLRVFRMTILNALNGPERRNINASNSIFMAAFGQETEKLLKRLGFRHIPDSTEQTRGLGYWHPPAPAQHPPNDPAHDEERAFLEDVRDEINILISKLPPAELAKLNSPVPEFEHAQKDFARILAIDLDKPVIVRGQACQILPTAPPYDQTVQPMYRDLGIVPNFPTAEIEWAYDQQVLADPGNEERYYKAWSDLAVNTGDEDMQTHIFMLGEAKAKMTIDEAYRALGMDSKHAPHLSDGNVLSAYMTSQDASSADVSRLRKALRTIGEARKSADLINVAEAMTLEQAYTYLGVSATVEDDSIIAAAAAKRADSDENAAKTIEAMQVISRHRKSEFLRLHLEGDDTPPPKMTAEKAHKLFGISEGASYDTQQLIETFEVSSAGRPDLREALEVISIDRNDQALKSYLIANGQNSTVKDLGEPRGLNNIGNTCYLASLLQYLYTLKVVRQIVGRIDEYAQPLGPESTPLQKKVDLEQVSRTQVQRALGFVRELDKLFTTLATTHASAVRPDVALARLTLERTPQEAVRRSTINRRPSNLPQLDGQAQLGGTSSDSAVDVDSAIDVTGSQLETLKEDVAMQDADNGALPNESQALHGQTAAQPEQNSSTISADLAPQGPPSLPPRPQNSTDSSVPSTNVVQEVEEWARQQDVREVIQRVIMQLRWAIQGDSTRENGEQVDLISRLFWGREQGVFIRRSLQEERSADELQPFPTIDTYLQEPCDIYGLLDKKFDYEFLDATDLMAKYSEITELPPILSITLERGMIKVEKGMTYTAKSYDPLRLPEHIYMDRYMAGETTLKKRRQIWETKEELRELKKQQEDICKTADDLDVSQSLYMTADYLHHIADNAEDYEIDTSMMDKDLFTALEVNASERKKQIDQINTEIAAKESLIKQQQDTLFADDKQYPYRIHAVLNHRSSEARVSSGHWIANLYDDKSKIWRSYNDETVMQVKDPSKFLNPTKEDGEKEGTSVFVVYVREDQADDLVETVYRNPAPAETQQAETQPAEKQQSDTQQEGFNGKVADVPGVNW